jgi:hypothetical protein
VTSPDLVRLDREIGASRARRAALPPPVAAAPSPTNGYHSAIAPTPDVAKWVQVDLGASSPIEEIRLVPARPTDFPDSPGFGFPIRFRVELADEATFARAETVADHSGEDFANPGDEPLVVEVARRPARFVRVTATRLWARRDDYVFALGEVEVLSGGKNVAPGRAVTARDSIEAGRWSKAALVDGFDSRLRLADRSDPAIPPLLRRREALSGEIRRLERQRQALAGALIDPETRSGLEETAAALADVEAQRAALPPPALVYALRSIAPRPIFLLHRGDVEQPGAPVAAGALSCVPGLAFDFPRPGPTTRGAAAPRWPDGWRTRGTS